MKPDDLFHSAQQAPARVAQPGELLFEFFVERTKRFYRCELRDHGAYGVEAQFLDPIDVRIARTFHQRLDPQPRAAGDGDRLGRGGAKGYGMSRTGTLVCGHWS